MARQIYKVEGRICFCPIAGITYQDKRSQDLYKRADEGTYFRLVREPSNQHDPNAICIQSALDGVNLGYIPAIIAVKLAPYLDQGKKYFCRKDTSHGYTWGVSIEREN